MRGRKPRSVTLAPGDLARLQRIARQPALPFFQAQRAGSPWPSPPAKRSTASPPAGRATPPPSGAPAGATSRTASLACWPTPTARGGPSGFPPLQRAQIIQLACLEPVARGLHIPHWSSADLARQAVQDGLVEAISPRSVRRILHAVDLQPHRPRFWKAARLSARRRRRRSPCCAGTRRLPAKQ